MGRVERASTPVPDRHRTNRVLAAATCAVNAGSCSASANALELSNRSASSFSRDFAIADANCGGTERRNSVTGRAVSATNFTMIICADEPLCGGSPLSASKRTEPSE